MDDRYLYISNLPWDANETMIRDAFADVVTFDELKLAIEPGQGRFMRYAFGKLNSEDDVEKAISEMNGKEVGELGSDVKRKIHLEPGLDQADLWERAFGTPQK